jgi:hypothetical protein
MSTMYLGRYAFDGDPTLLEAAYRRLAAAAYPPGSLDLHVVVVRGDGLDVYDACPDAETLAGFSASDEFRGALAAAGLPTPRVAGLGEVLTATLKQPVG